MVKKLTKEKKEYYRKKYDENEEINNHTGNAVMLIRLFGTKKELKKAMELKKKRDREGLTVEESNWLYRHGHLKYKKLN